MTSLHQKLENSFMNIPRGQYSLSDSEAVEWAEKMLVAGQGLYRATEQDMRAAFGPPGVSLYHYLQNSYYGRVCSICYS